MPELIYKKLTVRGMAVTEAMGWPKLGTATVMDERKLGAVTAQEVTPALEKVAPGKRY